MLTGSLQSRKGNYYTILNLYQNGKRRQRSIPLNIEEKPGNKRMAEKAHRDTLVEWEAKIEADANEKLTGSDKDMLFCDYVTIWLEGHKPQLEYTSYESYQTMTDKHICPYFRDLGITVGEIAYNHIQAYYDHKGQLSPDNTQALSANTLKKHHAIINQTLKRALKHDLILYNPCDRVTLPKIERFTGKFLSVEQGKTLLDVAKDTRIEFVIILGMMYGLRRSEIAGLKWKAIDFDNDTISIEHTVTKLKTEIAKDRTKNKSSKRILPLNSNIKDFLLNLRNQQDNEKLLLGKAYQESEYICRWADGSPMKCYYLSKAFKDLLNKNDLPSIRLHDLRHSCASYMLKAGCDLKEISDWLGHADIGTTANIYIHLDFEAKKSVANRLGSILSKKCDTECDTHS